MTKAQGIERLLDLARAQFMVMPVCRSSWRCAGACAARTAGPSPVAKEFGKNGDWTGLAVRRRSS